MGLLYIVPIVGIRTAPGKRGESRRTSVNSNCHVVYRGRRFFSKIPDKVHLHTDRTGHECSTRLSSSSPFRVHPRLPQTCTFRESQQSNKNHLSQALRFEIANPFFCVLSTPRTEIELTLSFSKNHENLISRCTDLPGFRNS